MSDASGWLFLDAGKFFPAGKDVQSKNQAYSGFFLPPEGVRGPQNLKRKCLPQFRSET